MNSYLTGPHAPKDGEPDRNSALRVQWVEGKLPGRAFVASTLWHIAGVLLLLLPIWGFLPQTRPNLAPVHIELTFYPPVQDLPQIHLPGPASKPSPAGDPAKPLPQVGADAYHPRQTILSTLVHITHPRQTLIQPDAPQAPPKIEPQLPNIAEWATTAHQPKLHITPTAAAPRMKNRAVNDVAAPEIANSEKTPGHLNIASAPMVNQHPQMPVTPMSAPVAKRRDAETDAAAPDVADVASSGDAGLHRIIALSATPAPPAPEVNVPQGNLAARIAISPDGNQPGVPGGAENGPRGSGGSGGNSTSMGGINGGGGANHGSGGGGNGGSLPAAVSISGGSNPGPNSGGIAPAGTHNATKLNLKPMTPLGANPGASSSRRGPASVANFDPNLPPEKLLSGKEIFTLHVNMPNLSSATGSWIIHCALLDEGDDPRFLPKGALSGPEILQKVDPKYPPELIKQHVDGEVILYAIIRKDGSVDSIQVVRGLEPLLDRNAMEALAHWKFRPGTREGARVDMEAVAHIPFHFRVSPDY